MDHPALVAGLAVGVTLAVIAGGYGLLARRRPPVVTGTYPATLDTVQLAAVQVQIDDIVAAARRDADRLVKDAELRAKDDAYRRREELDRELEAVRAELRDQQRRAQKRDDQADDRQREVTRQERELDKQRQTLAAREAAMAAESAAELGRIDALRAEATHKLLAAAGLTKDQAERQVLARVEAELASEIALKVQRHADQLKLDAEARAREVITTAVQRYAAAHVADSTVSTVDIPDDTMKGRIIGREGRNIRTFERATGVDVIVDDTPGVVIVSTFDNVRRETARLALTKLIADGRIHPTRIEEIVAETQAEMEKHILDTGTAAVLDAGVAMPHEKIVALLGRLKFRTSYSQNVLQHSLEVAHLCGLMAAEIGLDERLARRCGLLHDVGKAADHDAEGGHPKVGADLARRYSETSPEVLHAIAGHHDDITIGNIYTVLVAAADAISASRPGARRETLEKYVKRMADLEAVALGFPEVEAAFAIQAGRELRVIVAAGRTTDGDAARVCRSIAQAIQDRLNYPGEIKVTVIRETRVLEVAR